MKKRIVAFLLTLAMLVGLVPQVMLSALAEELTEAYTLENDFIRVSVSKKNGGFTVATREGDRLKKSDNNKKLLYHDGEYDTSFVTFRVTDAGGETKDYLFGGKYAGSSEVEVTQAQAGGEIRAVWSVGDLTFTETVALANAVSNENGMVSLSLAVENRGAPVKVRARILYDTFLDGSDYGIYQVSDVQSNIETVTTERVLDGSAYAIPQNFYAVDDPTSIGVAAYSVNPVLPEKVAFGHWNRLAETLYDFTPVPTLDFTDTRNEYRTADSAYALYFDLGDVTADAGASLVTYYGVYAHADVAASDSVAVDITAPMRLELTADKTDYIRQSTVGQADFMVTANFTNIDAAGAVDLTHAVLAVHTTAGLRPLNDLGAPEADYDFDTTKPMTTTYNDVKVGDTVTKTLYFEGKLMDEAAYERITIGIYDTSKTGGDLSETYKLGEAVAYILLPGSDGGVPKVSFASMTPKTVYKSGTRHLFVTLTNPAMLDNRANWNLCIYSGDGSLRREVPYDNLTVKDGVLDVAITEDIELPTGGYHLALEWTDAAVSAGVVPAAQQKQTAPALEFAVSDDIKYKNDAYGVLAVVETEVNFHNHYDILTFKDEASFEAYKKDTAQYKEILLTFRGEFSKTKTTADASGKKRGSYYTAVSRKTMDPDTRTYTVDNRITVNDCMDFEGGTLAVYYENLNEYDSPICVEFDGELYTSVARTSIWKGKAIFTKIEQGGSYSLIPYDENGNRGDNFIDTPISLIWNSAASVGQTLAGMLFKMAYGQLGTMTVEVTEEYEENGETKTRKIKKQCGVVAFAAGLDLGFTGAAGEEGAPGTKKDTYFDKLKELWAFYHEGTSLYRYAYDRGRIERMLDWSNIDEHSEQQTSAKGVNASVMVPDVLFGCGVGFVGVHFKVKVGLKNFVSALPEIEGEIEVNTINDWAFGVEGKVALANFTLEAKVSFKSRNNVPVPDELYVFVSGFKPGINIDGLGTVWITGGGGGIKNLYDTIFLTQAVPPLKLVMSVAFNVIQLLECEKATLAVGLTGVSVSAGKMSFVGVPALRVIDKMGLALEWYPGIDLKANIVVNLFDVIYGGGYIVLQSPDYKKVFFEMFARAQLRVPNSIPLVGGMQVAGIDLGISTEKIWGALEVLFITLGVTYYWGAGSVDFTSGSKASPTFPDLLGYDDVPVCYDAENDRTLYARFGTNTRVLAATADADGLVLLGMGAEIRSNADKTTHTLNFGTYDDRAGIVQMTFPASDAAEAKALADRITVGTAAGANDFPLVLYSGDMEQNNLATANANLTYDESTGRATLAFTVTDQTQFDKTFYVSTPAAAELVLYDVTEPPKLTTVSGSPAGSDLALRFDGENLHELDSVSFYLSGTNDPAAAEAGYPLMTATDRYALMQGEVTAALPMDVPTGDYYIRAVYSKVDAINGVAFSADTLHIENPHLPAAATVSAAAPSGDLKYSLTVDAATDANTKGYLVTVYDEKGNATDFSGITVERAASGATTFEVGGTYQASDGEGGSMTVGLAAGKRYTIGVTPYNLVTDGAGEIAVYGAETMVQPDVLPTPATPTVNFTADATAKTRTTRGYVASGTQGDIESLVYTQNAFTLTAAASEAVSGTWWLDEGAETAFADVTRIEIPLADLAEGGHTVTLTGKAADGDGFTASYTFTVDTLPPRLLLSAPVNGSLFAKDGKLTVTGVTDAGTRLTVTADGTAMLADVAVEDAGSFDAATGVFAVTVEIPDPNGAAQRRITVTVADDVGNAETVTATVTHGALADLSDVAILVGNATPTDGNIPIPAAGAKYTLSLLGVTSDGMRFVLPDDLVTFAVRAVDGDASVTDGGAFEASRGAHGIVTGKYAVADGAYRTATLTFGADAGAAQLVSVSATIGGSVTGGGTYAPGAEVTLTATPDAGYRFKGWTLVGVTVTDPTAATIRFTMPQSGNVTALATFEVTGGTGGGSSRADAKEDSVTARAGELVRVKLPSGKQESGYLPYYKESGARVFVPVAAAIDGEMCFIAPKNTTYFFGENPVSFADTASHWAAESTAFAAIREIFRGVSESSFAPDVSMTRAMFVTVFYRLAGSPAVEGTSGFADVAADAWYADAVAFAKQNGLVAGVSATKFAPDDKITREQMATLLYRFLGFAGYTLPENEAKTFTDADAVSVWAVDGVAYGQTHGLLSGRPDGSFAPQDNATRAECCTLFARMIPAILRAKIK